MDPVTSAPAEAETAMDAAAVKLAIEALPEPTLQVCFELLYSSDTDDVERNDLLQVIADVTKHRYVTREWKSFLRAKERKAQAVQHQADIDAARVRVEEQVGDRTAIALDLTNYRHMLPAIEDALVEHLGQKRVDHVYVRVAEDVLPGTCAADSTAENPLPTPRVVQFIPMLLSHTKLAIEASCALIAKDLRGRPHIAEVPEKVAKYLNEYPDKKAPAILGLVQHPLVTPTGRLLDRSGFDEDSGLLLVFGDWDFGTIPDTPTRDDALAAVQCIRRLMFEGTQFRDTHVDGAAMLAAYFLVLSRKVLAQAPAVLISATVQGTGKTTEARKMHVLATGRDMPVMAISPDANEFQKAMLATLMRSPPQVTFDNIQDGGTIGDGVTAAILTSPTYEGRLLRVSQMVTVPTNTTFVYTGNNITASPDFTRRLIKVDLLARQARPEQRHFEHADPVAYVRSIRAEVIRCVLTVQRAWFAAGCPAGKSFGCGPDFDRLVAWPLTFVGEGEGIFAKREVLAEQSPEEQAKLATILALAECFRGEEFTSAKVADAVALTMEKTPKTAEGAALREALESKDRRLTHGLVHLGRFLSSLVDQPPREGLVLRKRNEHGRSIYWVAGQKKSPQATTPSGSDGSYVNAEWSRVGGVAYQRAPKERQ